MARSSFERVKRHLQRKGSDVPAPAEMHGDLVAVVRRCDRVRSLGQAFGSVELSPYMKSLLRVSGLDTRAVEETAVAASPSVAAGV